MSPLDILAIEFGPNSLAFVSYKNQTKSSIHLANM